MQQCRGRVYANKFVSCTYDGHIIVFCIQRKDIDSPLQIQILNSYITTQGKYFIKQISLAAHKTVDGFEADTIIFLDDNYNQRKKKLGITPKNQDQD